MLRDFSSDLQKKKVRHSSDPQFLRDFQGDIKKKKTHVFLRIFEWSSQTNKTPGHFHQPAGTPVHGLKTGTYGKSSNNCLNGHNDGVK